MLTAGNDLTTRAHVADMLNHADDLQEYHDWLHVNTSIEDDVPEVPASIAHIERAIGDTIERQIRIAQSKGMTLDEYREDLADRMEQMREDLIAHRKYGFDGQYSLK